MKRSSSILAAATVILTAVIVYANSIHNPFIWDEEVIIVNNPIIKHLENFPRLFVTNIWGSDVHLTDYFYRPVYMLSFMFDYHFWKLNTVGYHLFSIIFHVMNALLLYVLAQKIGLSQKISWLASLLFILFPVNCESVSFIAGRGELIFAFFSLLCILTFMKATEGPRAYFYATYLLLILALLTKESAIILPLIILVYFLIFLNKDEKKKAGLAVFFLIAIVFLYWGGKAIFFGHSGNNSALSLINEAHFLERVYTVPRILLTYIQLVLLPVTLKSEYNFVVHSFKDPYVWIGAPFLVFLFVITARFLKPRKQTLFFICWVLIGTFPYWNIIIPFHATLMEHWVYFASIGYAVLMSSAIFAVMDMTVSKYIRYISVALLVSLMIFYAVKIIERNKELADPFILYQRDSQREPDSFLLHSNLGVEYFRRGMMEEAKKEFILSNDVAPGKAYYTSINNLGVIYAREGRISEAIACYKKSIALAHYMLAYKNLGEIYHDLKMYKEEISTLEEAARQDPSDPDILNRLGTAYYDDKNDDLAKAAFP